MKATMLPRFTRIELAIIRGDKARISFKQTGFVPIIAWKFVFEQANFIVTSE